MSSVCNKRDANVSTQQQVQGSVQVQDTSLSALPTALLQDYQNAIVLQLNGKQRGGKSNGLPISMAIILVAVGTIVWVLNITDTIKGPWSRCLYRPLHFCGYHHCTTAALLSIYHSTNSCYHNYALATRCPIT